MQTQSKKSDMTFDGYAFDSSLVNGNDYALNSFSSEDIVTLFFEKMEAFKTFFQQHRILGLADLLNRTETSVGKKSFLVSKNNKYITVSTENIAFFYVKYKSSIIASFDRQEYFVNHSLDKIQNLLNEHQFFRLNRRYLINFHAIKEVEHYFARKLLVHLTVPVQEKLLVSKEKVSSFLDWLENR